MTSTSTLIPGMPSWCEPVWVQMGLWLGMNFLMAAVMATVTSGASSVWYELMR